MHLWVLVLLDPQIHRQTNLLAGILTLSKLLHLHFCAASQASNYATHKGLQRQSHMLTTQQMQQDACLKTQEVLGKLPDESAGCKQQAAVFDHF